MNGPPANPDVRLRVLRDAPPEPRGDSVLHRMTAARRTGWNHALDRALELCGVDGRELLVLDGPAGPRPGRRWTVNRKCVLAAAALLAGTGLFVGCVSTWERRDPTGEPFPAARGTALDGTPVELPDAFRGRPVVLLVGYKQNSQFDIDRWLLGLAEAGVDVDVREIPTLPGLLPGAFSGWIDGGMRRGIPREDWGAVVTVYGDADAIAAFTGNDDGLPGRVLLLDGEGRVAFFHDRGYSGGSLRRLREALAGLRGGAAPGRP